MRPSVMRPGDGPSNRSQDRPARGPTPVVAGLHAEPELGRSAEVAGEPHAVSGVIARLPWTISLIRISATRNALASAYWLIASGSRKSPRRTSPGWAGGGRPSSTPPAASGIIVDDLDGIGVTVVPDEADAPLIVDPDAVLPRRSPASASRRLPAGARRSCSGARLWSCKNLRLPVRSTSCGTPLTKRRSQAARAASSWSTDHPAAY